jgi:hypothetical protein
MTSVPTSVGFDEGVFLWLVTALAAWRGAGLGSNSLQLSLLTLAILAGILVGNIVPGRWGAKVQDQDRAGLLDYLFTNCGPRPDGR